MAHGPLPPETLSRFRAISLERLDRIEAAWTQAVQDPRHRELTGDILRELHTLKGDSRAVGFADVNLLVHRLEDLVTVAQQRDFQLPDDFDLVVAMGLRFLAVLMRKKLGSSLGGIDLAGFLHQVDAVLVEARNVPSPIESSGPIDARIESPVASLETDHVATATIHRLTAAATLVWLEWQAEGRRQIRLRQAFDELRAQAARLRAVPLAPRLLRHTQTLPELAHELGKQAAIELDVGEVRLSPRAAEAVDVAVMHSLRNALDHGIERPAERRAAGKPRCGQIRVQGRIEGQDLQVVIEDDGAGVDLERVRACGIAMGIEGVAAMDETDLLELLFRPGFSTRSEVSAVAGRGVGLAAVRAALEPAGGRIVITQAAGRGTRITLVIPHDRLSIEVWCVEATAQGLLLALPAAWRVVRGEGPGTSAGVDPVTLLALGRGSGDAARVLTLREGESEVRLRVGAAAPRLAWAERMCATADGEPCEVVRIEGQEALLVRPLALLGEVRS